MTVLSLQTVKKDFTSEIWNAENKKKSSVSFLLHEIPSFPLVAEEEEFLVLVIGGSVCKIAKIKKIKGKIEVLNIKKAALPAITSKEIFFDFISKYLTDHRVVGLNFAYPLKPIFENGRLDGILLNGSKEHKFDGLIGEKISSSIEKYIKEKYGKKIIVSTANDTVCLLLAGLSKYPWKKLAAGIMGTGTNTALFLDKTHLVNLESAGFNKFTQSPEGKEIDKNSRKKGSALFEKETAGAYLYKHFKEKKLNSTLELKEIALSLKNPLNSKAIKLLEYSAGLFAAQLAGLMEFQKKDLKFVMDGSFFWEKDIYKDIVSKFLSKLTKYEAEFIYIEDAAVMGGAYLVS